MTTSLTKTGCHALAAAKVMKCLVHGLSWSVLGGAQHRLEALVESGVNEVFAPLREECSLAP